jgi:hypothetical protein
LLLERSGFDRPERIHYGKVIMRGANLCLAWINWSWNGDVIWGALFIDAHNREIIACRTVANAGISGSDVRDILLEAVEYSLAPAVRQTSSSFLPTTAVPTRQRKLASLPVRSA